GPEQTTPKAATNESRPPIVPPRIPSRPAIRSVPKPRSTGQSRIPSGSIKSNDRTAMHIRLARTIAPSRCRTTNRRGNDARLPARLPAFTPGFHVGKYPGGRSRSEKRGVQADRNGPSEDRKCWQRVELGIHGLHRWAVNCLEMSGKRGVQTHKTRRARTEVLAAPWEESKPVGMRGQAGDYQKRKGLPSFWRPGNMGGSFRPAEGPA